MHTIVGILLHTNLRLHAAKSRLGRVKYKDCLATLVVVGQHH